jgi:hypothetical protein
MKLPDYHFLFHIVYKMDDAKRKQPGKQTKKNNSRFHTKSVFKSARSVVLFFKLK